jgi:hypothetical protein
MVCSISCSISAVFVIGMIYFYNSTNENSNYREKLSPELQIKYDAIASERMRNSYFGYLLGLALSLVIIYYNSQVRKNKLNNKSLICIVISTTFLANYFYYILTPKSDWMLNHLTSKEETSAWIEMYRSMQYKYHFGLVLGVAAVGILGHAFRC